jgi:REP element-mobilizing transposase RayT
MKRILLSKNDAYYYCSNMTVHNERCFDPEARAVFVNMLHKVAEFCGVSVVTYCVMENHFHLLVKVPEQKKRDALSDAELLRRFELLYGNRPSRYIPIDCIKLKKLFAQNDREAAKWRNLLKLRMCDLSMFMKLLKQRYSKWYNATHNTQGTLWSDRYTSTLLESSALVLRQVACAIDLHAVKEGIVEHPEDYLWCGYGAAMAGKNEKSSILITELRLNETSHPKPLLWYEAELYEYAGLTPKASRRKILATFLNSERKLFFNTYLGDMYDSRIDTILILTSAVVYGSYIFLESTSHYVSTVLKRKKAVKSHQIAGALWTFNQRSKKINTLT